MNEEDKITKALREVSPRYIADSQQRLLGFLLTPEEYQDYLEMRLHTDVSKQTLREARSPYIVDSSQQPLGFLLTPEEYENYLELLHVKAEQDAAANEITARLDQVYASESSSLDPALLRLQLASLDEKPW